jgi:hypothetical protein
MFNLSTRNNSAQRAFALLTTMLLLALLIAVTVQLTVTTSFASVIGAKRHRSLPHELAVDSGLALLADTLAGPNGKLIVQRLDAVGEAELGFELGEVFLQCRIHDDAAKFNPRLFGLVGQEHLLSRTVAELGGRLAMPPAKIDLQPTLTLDSQSRPTYVWFDQFFADLDPGALLPLDWHDRTHRTWSDALTLWGDGRVDLRRASVDVLNAALADLQPGLAAAMLSVRPTDKSRDFLQTALAKAPAEIREQVAARVGFDLRRYSIYLETSIAGDRRSWYIVAQHGSKGLSILHRGQVSW